MSWETKFNHIIDNFKEGKIIGLSKMISLIENNIQDAWKIISKLPEPKEKCQIIGLTGSPGAGKSTIVSKLAQDLTEKGKKIGIIAVDPSSPFSGGAFLGDRIRMRNLSNNDKIYIRSVASRGSVGGLCDSIYDIVDVLDSFGFDKVIVETVGAGQSEVEVVYVADTILLALSPDSGDEVQMFKAGIMEIADAYIVNKIDLNEADKFLIHLKNTLSLESENKINRKIFPVSAINNKGIEKVVSWFEDHYIDLKKSGEINERLKRRFKRRARSNLIRKLDLITNNYEPKNNNLDQIKKDFIDTLIKEEKSNEK